MQAQSNSLFETNIVDAYRTNFKIQSYLKQTNSVLLNKQELLEYIYQAPLSLARPSRTVAANSSAQTIDRLASFRGEQSVEFIHQMTDDICKDAIGEEYGLQAAYNALSYGDEFDILVVADANYGTVRTGDAKEMVMDKIGHIKAFIIVQKGECKTYPNAYAINLICARVGTKSSILLGAYLHSIKIMNGVSKIGLLELALGYTNIPGTCAYTKFGFVEDLTLFGHKCFSDPANLPMSVYLGDGTDSLFSTFVPDMTALEFSQTRQEYTTDDIINTVVTNKPPDHIHRFVLLDLCIEAMPDRGDLNQARAQQKLAKQYNRLYQQKIKNMSRPSDSTRSAIDQLQRCISEQKNAIRELKHAPKTKRARLGATDDNFEWFTGGKHKKTSRRKRVGAKTKFKRTKRARRTTSRKRR